VAEAEQDIRVGHIGVHEVDMLRDIRNLLRIHADHLHPQFSQQAIRLPTRPMPATTGLVMVITLLFAPANVCTIVL
jgi:hypothetical protein